MELDKLELGTEDQTTIAAELKQIALTVPDETKEQLINSYLRQVPTAEEIKKAIDWSSLTNSDISTMMQQAGVSMINNGVQQVNMPLEQWAQMYGKSFEGLIDSYVAQIHDSLTNNRSSENLSDFTKQYMPDFSPNDEFAKIMSNYGPISNEHYEELEKEWENTGMNFASALSHGASIQLLDSSSFLRTDMQTALEAAAANPFTISPTINLMADYNIVNPSQRVHAFNLNVDEHAAGGYVSGGAQLSWLAEEGYGEFIIPTNPSRRARALDLYEQAGVALGISAHADGGYVGAPGPNNTTSSYDLINDVNGNALTAYNDTTEGNYNEKVYETISAGVAGVVGDTVVHVNVELSPEFVIHTEEGQNEETIMQIIRRHMKEMADEMGGEIAEKLEEVFLNMPLKEA